MKLYKKKYDRILGNGNTHYKLKQSILDNMECGAYLPKYTVYHILQDHIYHGENHKFH